jgi:hypothetical protein
MGRSSLEQRKRPARRLRLLTVLSPDPGRSDTVLLRNRNALYPSLSSYRIVQGGGAREHVARDGDQGHSGQCQRNVSQRESKTRGVAVTKRIHIVMTSHCYSVDTGFASKVRASLPDTDLEYVLEWDDSYDDLWAGGVVSE